MRYTGELGSARSYLLIFCETGTFPRNISDFLPDFLEPRYTIVAMFGAIAATAVEIVKLEFIFVLLNDCNSVHCCWIPYYRQIGNIGELGSVRSYLPIVFTPVYETGIFRKNISLNFLDVLTALETFCFEPKCTDVRRNSYKVLKRNDIPPRKTRIYILLIEWQRALLSLAVG